MSDPVKQNNPLPETLGSRLRQLRIAKPYLTQRQAAALVGLDPQWLSKVEADRVKPAVNAVDALAKVYGADVIELILLWARWEQAPAPDFTDTICTGRTL